MEHILESLDEAVFTPDLKAEILAKIASEVAAAEDKAMVQIEEKDAALKEALDAIEQLKSEQAALAEAYAQQVLKEEMDAYKAEIEDQAQLKEEYTNYIAEQHATRAKEFAEYTVQAMQESVSNYLDEAVKAFVEDNRTAIDESVEIEKVNAILEGIDSIVYTTGVSVASIQEAIKKEDVVVAEGSEELKAKIDSLIKENAELRKAQVAKEKEAVVESITKDLTVVQRDRFDRIAKIIPFNESSVEVYKESLEKVKQEILDKVDEEEETIEESVTAEQIVESAKPAYMRFL
jgi:hypothetical protein